MTRHAIAVAILVCLLIAGIAVVLTQTGLISRRITEKAREASPESQLARQLGISLQTATELSGLSRSFGLADPLAIVDSELIDTIGRDELTGLLEGAVPAIEQSLDASNAGRDFTGGPRATGDALFDRYATALGQVLDGRGSEDVLCQAALPVVPDEELAAWVADFGADPRYWELRYISLLLSSKSPLQPGKEPTPEDFLQDNERGMLAAEFLEEARDRGVADANTLMLLYGERCRARWLATGWLETASLGVAEPADDELAELVDQAVALAPDEAWPLYLRAFNHFNNNETALALADLAAGNNQPVNVHPRPFPLITVLRSLGESAPAGDAIVSGASLTLARDYPITYVSAMRAYLRQTLDYVEETGDLTAVNTWHQFSCRYAQSWPEDPLMPMVALSFISQIADYMLRRTALDTGNDRRETLSLLLRARDEANVTLVVNCNSCAAEDAMLVLGLVDGARGACMAYYLQAENQAELLATRVQPVITDISAVSYPALERPAQLTKYSPGS